MATIIASDDTPSMEDQFGPATTRRWKVLESDKPSPIYNGIVCMISASDRVIAVVTEDEQPFYPDDWPAAARTIAAAPDMLAALKAIMTDPHGCVFCDSGKLRNPNKPHEPDCGFALAGAAILKAESQT